jgi:tRNA(Ile)-lysidine synthase
LGGQGHRGVAGPPGGGPLAGEIPRGAAALVAVSGGPDSVALLHLVADARPDLALTAGHVRHGLRDDAADARVAAAHAVALGVPFLERSVAVDPDRAGGLEAVARDARYAALVAMAREAGAGWVLTGHTADDQAETVLLNAARGSGTRGLAGMPRRRRLADGVELLRPLLDIPRADVRALIADRGLEVAEDPTNADRHRRRARARAETLPVLAGLTGHGSVDGLRNALVRLAGLARDDADALDALAATSAERLVVAWGPARAARLAELDALPPALASRVVRRLLTEAGGTPDSEAVHAVRHLGSGALHVPGGAWVTAGGGWLAARPADCDGLTERPVAVPGATDVPEIGMAVVAGPPRSRPRYPPGLPGPAAGALPDRGDLVVRGRRPGDRFAGGRLADALEPVPRALRDLVPVVAAGPEVVWVPGLAPPPAEVMCAACPPTICTVTSSRS